MNKKQLFSCPKWSGNKKLILVLKLTSFFMFFTVMAMAARTYSQATRFDLNVKNATISEVIDNEAQDDKLIKVSGKVTDSSGIPLPGVTIVVFGTQTGTISDGNGNYSLSNVPANATLQFSFVGMKMEEIAVGNRSSINATLADEAIRIDEVVAVGYGTQKKINLTGAIDVVNEKQIGVRSVTNLSEALQGVSPNLNFTVGQNSGEPGGKMDLNIRGIGSLTGNYSPYVLVDGVEMDMNLVNPSDIKSITVLKDAAASAIYGARAPYGVILVTTKNGEMNEKVKVSYSNNISFSDPLGLPHTENSLRFVTAFDQANMNAGLPPNFTPENYERIKQYQEGKITDETWLNQDGSDWNGNNIWSMAGNANNDWMHIYYKDKVMRQKHDININGGGKSNSYFVSAGFLDQPGELRYGDEYFKRFNLTANLVSKATDWLTFNLNTKYVNSQAQYFVTNTEPFPNGEADRLSTYGDLPRLPAYRPLYLPNGEFSSSSVVPELIEGGKENRYNSDYILSFGAALEPIKDWKTTMTYNYKNNSYRDNTYNKAVSGTFPNGSEYIMSFPVTSYATSFSSETYSLFNITSSYNKTFKGHYFSLMGGYENELDKYNSIWGKKNDVLSVPSISTSTGNYYLDDSKSHWATEGFFGRFNYNYEGKYLLEVNARYDGSSKFEEDSRWGFFPSMSLGYNLSKEEFWSSIEPYVNNFKLRGSWGKLGNQNVPNYLYLSTIGVNTELGWLMGNNRPIYTLAPDLVSSNLTWETSSTANIGFDASFLKGRLSSTFDIYNRITSNMFGPSEALPGLLGTSPPESNNATLQTNGFELVIEWKDRIGSNLSYNIRASLADNVTTVKEYSNPTKTLSTWYEGRKLGDIWGLTTVGIYQSDAEAANGPDQSRFWPVWGAGDIQYKDLDGDKIITDGTYTAENAGDYSVIGNNLPRFLTGISAGMEWKGFDFSMFWQGVLKRDWSFEPYDMSFYGFCGDYWWQTNAFNNGENTTLDYWRPANETNILGANTDAYYSKPYISTEDFKNRQVQSRYTQSAAYLRLKNLTLGYTLPSNITKKAAISNARIFVSGENLITFTPLTKLFDPELLYVAGEEGGVGKIHPMRKIYAVGINLTF